MLETPELVPRLSAENTLSASGAYSSGFEGVGKKFAWHSMNEKKGKKIGVGLFGVEENGENPDVELGYFSTSPPLIMEEESHGSVPLPQGWKRFLWRIRATLSVILLVFLECGSCIWRSMLKTTSATRPRYSGRLAEGGRRSEGTLPLKKCSRCGRLWCYVLLACCVVSCFLWCTACHNTAKYYLFAPEGDYFFTSSSLTGSIKGQEPFVFSQLQFVSCNQHNLPQTYWVDLSNAAMNDLQETYREINENRAQSALVESSSGNRLSILPSESATQDDYTALLASCQKNCRAAWQADTTPTAVRIQDCSPPPLDAFIWLGDIIYADKPMKTLPPPPSSEVPPGMLYSFDTVKEMWRTQFNSPEYAAFRQTCVSSAPPSSTLFRLSDKEERALFPPLSSEDPALLYPSSHTDGNISCTSSSKALGNEKESPIPAVWGVWDDHDMGINDGGKEFLWKNISRNFLLDFLQVPPDDARRQREEGVFTFHTVNTSLKHLLPSVPSSGFPSSPPHLSLPSLMGEALSLLYENLFCVILLDVRSFRDPANSTESGDMLGEPQWEWLEQILRENVSSFLPFSMDDNNTSSALQKEKCASVLIGSGVQIFLDEKVTEHWGSYPHSRDRLLQLLRKYRIERVVFLTGDVHMGELGSDFSSSTIHSLLGYPVVEGTSSGLTHSADFTFCPRPEKETNYFSLLHPMRWLVPALFPSSRRTGLYVGKNFGSVKLETIDPSKLGNKDNGSAENQNENVVFKEKLKQLIDLVQNPSSGTLFDTAFVGDNSRAKYKEELQYLVENAVNVTLTIFSLDLHNPAVGSSKGEGKKVDVPPVVSRLSFSLGMLTYDRGGCYVNSKVDPHAGWVKRDVDSYALCLTKFGSNDLCCRRSSNISLPEGLEHYASTTPLPFFTRCIQVFQKLVFPGERMLFLGYTTRDKIRRELRCLRHSVTFLAAFCLVFVVLCIIHKAQKYRQAYSRISEL